MTQKLGSQIEAILFYKTDALAVGKLSNLLGASEESIRLALIELEDDLKDRGITLSRIGDEVMLTTNKENSRLIEKLSKEELEGELSKASIETLSIILYKNGATKGEIDYIRGVNAGFILRALQIRGLVERTQNPKDGRAFIYKPTTDLYNFLGITKIDELPDFTNLTRELTELNNQNNENAKKEDSASL